MNAFDQSAAEFGWANATEAGSMLDCNGGSAAAVRTSCYHLATSGLARSSPVSDGRRAKARSRWLARESHGAYTVVAITVAPAGPADSDVACYVRLSDLPRRCPGAGLLEQRLPPPPHAAAKACEEDSSSPRHGRCAPRRRRSPRRSRQPESSRLRASRSRLQSGHGVAALATRSGAPWKCTWRTFPTVLPPDAAAGLSIRAR